MRFIGWAFKGEKRKDLAFSKGFYLSMALVIIAVVLFFIQFNRMFL
jgi:hypothetical protein